MKEADEMIQAWALTWIMENYDYFKERSAQEAWLKINHDLGESLKKNLPQVLKRLNESLKCEQ